MARADPELPDFSYDYVGDLDTIVALICTKCADVNTLLSMRLGIIGA